MSIYNWCLITKFLIRETHDINNLLQLHYQVAILKVETQLNMFLLNEILGCS
jgi:hypothetical protein